MKKIFVVLLSIIIFAGCQKEKTAVPQSKLNESSLRRLVIRAADEIKSANDSLSGIFDLSLPNNKSYHNLTINSLKLPSGKNMFFVLIEYPNPVYNRFAAYDESGNGRINSYLIDKSLNGQLSQKMITINGKSYVQVNEGFLTKDIIELSRLSLYRIFPDSVLLVFRDFTKIKLPKREYEQVIKDFSDNQIQTEINSSRRGYEPKEDIFVFNQESKMYESKVNMFNALVNYLINNFDHKTKNPQITDKASASESAKKPS